MICTMHVCQASADIGCSLQAELSKELEKWSLRKDDLKRQIVSSPDKLRAVSTVCSAIYSHIYLVPVTASQSIEVYQIHIHVAIVSLTMYKQEIFCLRHEAESTCSCVAMKCMYEVLCNICKNRKACIQAKEHSFITSRNKHCTYMYLLEGVDW